MKSAEFGMFPGHFNFPNAWEFFGVKKSGTEKKFCHLKEFNELSNNHSS